ncbi:inositol monophosphatase family protein [Sulfitobacter donghicola]|uniref:Inositol monophosphatase n=1 Tax=Sulfitobacter donghicola DSW-25 = KCTC 12864 = JCM 14565 TaxID=1300350 RepID=A0A073IJX2_9RHOB|nr:inositol monophosphatase family protein [Sulfitobacter donghicola]KEJ89890.1 inositol monophosphatase [Sulfitobacter donghicola DSW-25 = KCTC 12864 = JCM 14565]KIN66985.1 Inositol monophosphatase family protein [Sulfitobacter donghicola DSW-25 = KCTC 12864 = JCM 14565]
MRNDPELTAELTRVAHLLADAARAAILPYFRSANLGTDNKLPEGYDPVTEADRAGEAAMRAILDEQRPQDGILGEELGTKVGTTGLTWVLDPIDGTRGFVSGTPTWGVLIAVGDEAGPFIGIVDQPYIAERFIGSPEGATLIRAEKLQPLQTRKPRPLSEAIVFTTFPEVGSPEEGAAFHAVAKNALLTRYGMDCYAYALVASGQIDLVIEACLQPYDIQGPLALIEAAGGVVTDWDGGPAHQGGRVIAAANSDIHAEALEILRKETQR